jgi:hypothetical protein
MFVGIVRGNKSYAPHSVMDPNPGKIVPYPDPSSSGSEMNLKQNYSEKLVKFHNFLTKMLILKI